MSGVFNTTTENEEETQRTAPRERRTLLAALFDPLYTEAGPPIDPDSSSGSEPSALTMSNENAEEAPAAAQAVIRLDPTVVALLAEINGQDCYDAKIAAVGKLSSDHYLMLPNGFDIAGAFPSEVGLSTAMPSMTEADYCQIYHLNKPVFEAGDAQIKGALLRAELVKAGWLMDRYEVKVVAPADADAVEKTMLDDLNKIKEFIADAKTLALLLPLAAEHTFRTMGHHYLSSLSSEYTAKYAKYFAACVQPNLANYLPPEILYHRAAHWVSLAKALAVSRDEEQALMLPNAVIVRSTAGPSGSAVITTTEAILKALAQTGLKAALVEASGVDIAKIESMSAKVKENPGKYHTIPTAYGETLLSARDKAELDAAKEMAYLLAPVLQGFLDSLPRNADLPQAKALVKHADTNPLLRKRAKLFFKEVGSTKAANMKELFAGDKRGIDVVGNTDKVSAEALQDEEE